MRKHSGAMHATTDTHRTLDALIAEHHSAPINILGLAKHGESAYLNALRASYKRTLDDVVGLCAKLRRKPRILELGAYLGVVSVSLRRLGYEVRAADIPEFHQSASLQAFYARNETPFDPINLREGVLPYASDSFDIVILCEVLEHLNFNPLPAIAEINRVLRLGGYLYLGMPNQASVVNRVKLAVGKSIHDPIGHYFAQLDRTGNMLVGLHWREYTRAETHELLMRLGFEIESSSYFSDFGTARGRSLRHMIGKLLYLYPPFRPFQVVTGKKITTPEHDFFRVEVNS